MFFSVIIPVYNVEKYLRECIDSILSQSFDDYEIILVNDGSTDSSPAICDEYVKKDSRVKVIHKENGGASVARNIGTDIAIGKYILYLDSDDYISDKEFFAELYKKAEAGNDVIIYKFKKYFEDEKRFGKCQYAFPEFEQQKTLAEKTNYLVKTDSFYCAGWSKAIRSEIIKNNNIRFLEGIVGEDQEWYYRVLEHVKTIGGIDKDFIVYRQHANSVTSTNNIKKIFDCTYVVDEVQKRLLSIDVDDSYKNALLASAAKLYCNLLIAYCSYKGKRNKELYNKLKELSFLLKYDVNPRVATFNKLYKVAGFDITMFFLKIICKVR